MQKLEINQIFTKINFSFSYEDVEIIRCYELDRPCLEIMDDCYDYNVSDGELEILYLGRGGSKRKIEIRCNLSDFKNLFTYIKYSDSVNLRLYLPVDYPLEEINIETKSGDIFLRNLSSDNLFIKTASGDLYLYDSTLKNMQIKTLSGDIKAKKLNFFEGEIISMSGDIDFNLQNVSHKALIKSMSGDITINCENKNTNVHVSADSVSGDIEVDASWHCRMKEETIDEQAYLMVKSMSGDINLS